MSEALKFEVGKRYRLKTSPTYICECVAIMGEWAILAEVYSGQATGRPFSCSEKSPSLWEEVRMPKVYWWFYSPVVGYSHVRETEPDDEVKKMYQDRGGFVKKLQEIIE